MKYQKLNTLNTYAHVAMVLAWLVSQSFALAETFTLQLGDTVAVDQPASGAGRIESAGERDTFYFTNTPGQRVAFVSQGGDPAWVLRWTVVDAQGNQVLNRWISDWGQQVFTLPYAGTNRIVVYSNDGEATGTYGFQVWPAAVEQFPIAFGQTVTNGVPGAGAGNIETPGAQDVYTFTAQAGQVVYLEGVEASPSNGNLRWELFGPAGASVNSAWLAGDMGRQRLNESGVYRIVVQGDNQATGTYSFKLWSVNDASYPIAMGDTVTNGVPGAGAGVIEIPGEQDTYTFNAQAGQVVYLEGVDDGNWSYWNLEWVLYSPSGVQLAANYAAWDIGRQELKETGLYRIVVYGNSPDTAGGYSFKLLNIEDQSFAIVLGDTVADGVPSAGAGNIETPGAQDFYTFHGQAGQVVYPQQLGSAADGNGLWWELRDANNNLLVRRGFYDDLDRVSLPAAGTYRIIVGGDTRTVGTYSFTLWEVADQSFAIAFGSTVAEGAPGAGAGEIGVPGERDIYTFSAQSGQIGFFELIDSSVSEGYLWWELLDPNGVRIASDYLPQPLGRKQFFQTGTYRIVVHGNLSTTGTYSFSMRAVEDHSYAVNLGVTVPEGVPGTGAGNIETPGAQDVFAFSAQAGQIVFLEGMEIDESTWNLWWELVNPSGVRVAYAFLPEGIGRQVLSETGTYRIVVHGDNDSYTGLYGFKLRNVTDQDFSIAAGDTVANGIPRAGAGNIESPGVEDRYWFTNSPGQTLFFALTDVLEWGRFGWAVYDCSGAHLFDRDMAGGGGKFTLALAGTNYVRVYGLGTNTGSYSFTISKLPTEPITDPDNLELFNLALNTTVAEDVPSAGAGRIATLEEVDVYSFSGLAGQVVYLDWLLDENYMLYWELRDPLDRQLSWTWYGSDLGRFTLPLTGIYRVRVGGYYGDTAGTYSFSLSVIQDQPFAIVLGDTVTNGVPALGAGNIEVPGAQDIYTFSAQAGQVVFLDQLDDSISSGNLWWELQDPRGNSLAGTWMYYDIGRVTLPETGTYRIYVRSDDEVTGTYSFQLHGVRDDSFAIALGGVITNGVPGLGAGNIETLGARDLYSFNAQAGQVVYLGGVAVEATSWGLYWTLLDPTGTQVAANYFGSDFGRLTLAQSGAYRLVVRGESETTGTYTFNLLPVADQSFNLAVGDIVTDGVPTSGAGNIEALGVQDTYTFSAQAGQVVYLNVLEVAANNGSLWWELINPDGARIVYQYMPQDIGRQTLDKTGTYRIIVHGENSATGTYSFALRPVADHSFTVALGDAVADGVPGAGAGNIESPGAMDVYTFDGQAGQIVFLKASEIAALNGDLWWEVRDPSGNRLVWNWLSGGLDRLTLPLTGLYRVNVGGYGLASGTYRFQLWGIQDHSFAIAPGDTVAEGAPGAGAGNIETPGARDVYTFNAQPGQTIYLKGLDASNGNTWWELRDPLGASLGFAWLSGDLGRFTLSMLGTYRLTVGASDGATGAYSFKLWGFENHSFVLAPGMTVTNGAPGLGAGNLEIPGSRDFFSVNGQPGQVIYLQTLASDENLAWELVNPLGNQITWTAMGYDLGRFVLDQDGPYLVRVDGYGGATGAYSFKFWGPEPEILSQPQDLTVPVGNQATFRVEANYPTALQYQWQFNGTNLPGETSPVLRIADAQADQAGPYNVLVSSGDGTVASRAALLSVIDNPVCVTPSAGLLGWWSGDNTLLSLVGTNNITPGGALSFAPGKVGQGLHFQNSPALVAGDFDFTSSNAFTFETWFRLNEVNGNYQGLLASAPGCCSYRLLVAPWGQLLYDAGTHTDVSVGADIATGQFYHVAMVITGGGTAQIYLNGELVSESASGVPSTLPNFQSFYLGSGEDTWYAMTDGILDEPAIYNRALSGAEIAAIYHAASAGKCKALDILTQPQSLTQYEGLPANLSVLASGVGTLSYQWWKGAAPLENATNAVFSFPALRLSDAGDYQVVVSDGFGSVTSQVAVLTVLSATPCAPVPANLVAWWPGDGTYLDLAGTHPAAPVNNVVFAEGMVGQAFSLDGSGAALTVDLNAPTGPFTIEAWVKFTGDSFARGSYQTLFEFGNDSPWFGVEFDGTLNMWGAARGGRLPVGSWAHIAYTWNGANSYLYINGAQTASSSSAPSQGGQGLGIGQHSGDTAWLGLIDEPAIYSRALAAEEINAIVAAGYAGKCKAALAILAQPQSVTTNVTRQADFSVAAVGNGALSYQWWKGQSSLEGATGSLLSLPNLQLSDAGEYWVVVSDTSGSVTSLVATLTLIPPPQISSLVPASATAGNLVVVNGAHLAGATDVRIGEVSANFTIISNELLWVYVPAEAVSGLVSVTTLSGTAVSAANLVITATPQCQAPPAGLIGWWSGEGNSIDMVAANHGTLMGGAGFAPGMVGQAFSFDGQNDYVLVSAPAMNFGTGDFTFQTWAKTASTKSWNTLVSFDAYNPALYLRSDGRLEVYSAGQSTVGGLNDGQWHHIAIVRRAGAITYYTDGVPAGSASFPNNLNPTTFMIGWDNWHGDEFAGLMDEVALFNRALAPEEIVANFNARSAGMCGAGGFRVRIAAPDSGSRFDAGQPIELRADKQGGADPVTYAWSSDRDGALGAGATLTVGSLTSGEHRITVLGTDQAGATNAASITVTVQAVPDLFARVTAFPATAVIGRQAVLHWSVTNQGTAKAEGPWYETILLADNAAGNNAQSLFTLAYWGRLEPGQSIIRTQAVILPAGLAGQYWLGLSVDIYGHVFEGNGEANNLAMAGDATELTAPDFVVESIAAAPNAYFGRDLQVTWVVRNVGDAAVDAASSDQLVFRSESGAGGEWSLGWFAAPKLLAAGEAYTNSATVTLPLTEALAAGDFLVRATADANGTVSESIEWNNTNSTPVFRVTMPPLPDLTVANIGVFSTNAGAVEPLAQVQPGQTVRLTWVTTNQGPAVAGGGWTERVYLSSNPAQSSGQTIATLTVTNALAAGQFLARTQTVIIPIDSEIGSLRFGVQTDNGNVLLEENENNNLAWAEQPVQVPGTLTFQLSGSSVAEGQRLSGFVWRNGSRAQALTVTLAGSDNSELAVTSPMIIDAGQSAASFEVQGVSDGMVDGPQLVQLTAGATDFASAQAAITVLDVDIPKLTLQLAAPELLEGASLQGTVTRELVTAQPLTVYLSKSGSSRLQVAEVVTIAANQASASFMVSAQDNWKVEGPRACAISAQATGYQSISAALTLLDNDLPAFSMSLNTTNVSEGAGPQAAVATLARMPVTVEPLYVELVSDDTNVVRVPAFVAVPGGETALTIPVAAVDNMETNAARVVRVDAYVLDALTGERLSLTPDASVTLLVSDDDGPTLRLVIAKKIVGEGLSPATTATVSRNTGTSGALMVELASRDTSEATVPESVTIPDGKNSATFEINSVADGVTDGSQMVAIVASHDNYVGASDTLTVTDSDLPDLTVAVLQSPGTVETEAYTLISYRFANDGTAPTQGTVVLRAYLSRDEFLSGEDMLLEEYTYTGDLPLEVPVQRSASVRMPREAGRYWVIVQADGSAVGAPELRLDNNVAAAAQPTIVAAAYTAQVWAIDHSAPAGTSIRLAGKVFTAANQPVPYGLASIHVMQGSLAGAKRIIAAVADAQGNFTTSFVPLGNEAGVYLIGATHPGSADVVEQDRFRLLGIEAKPTWVQARVIEGSTVSGSVTLINPADVPLTGVSVGVVESSPNLEVTGVVNDTVIAELSSITLNYEIKALEASLYRAYAVVRVACAQGVFVDVPFYVTVDPLLPELVATPAELVHGMKRGEQTVVEFEVVNLGGAETGPLTVFLPALDWLTLVSTNPMPSLLPGGANTNRVLLLLSPAADMVLGEYPGRLAINGTNTSLGVAFNFRAMSEAHGDLLVIAEDEYTFHAQGSPHVANAAVVVRDAVSGTVVTNGLTDVQGQFFAAGLVENYYQVEVSAEQHSSYRGTSLLVAGRVNEVHAFMPRQAVQYIWKVEPTEIEDRTKITIETTFETMVPMPVITVQPNLIDLDEYANAGVGYLEMMVTNHGLVAGLDATITFDAHELWEIKPLVENLGTLSAMGGMVVPVQIRRLTNAALSRCDIPCQINGRVSYSLLSGGNTYRYSVPLLAAHAWVNCVCPSPTPPPCVGCGGGPGWVSGGGGGGAVIPVNPPTPQYEPPPQCVPHLDGVCAKVKLRLDQEAVLSRDAFKATLELINGTTLDLSGVRIDLDIRNSEGALVTNLFGIYPPTLTGLSAVDGTGVVGANATGTAQWIIVPSVDAAPSKPVQYKVGGTLVYVDNGQTVTIALAPTPITVYPLPQIKLDYFHERDVLADDPFTAPKEPSIPYNLAVLAQNTGQGDARKMRIVSAQPKIIENLSGLLIDFKIIATEVAGQSMTPSLTADFGEIPAGTTKVARWLLTSTLHGQFTEYKATFQHQDDLGNPRLLIITNVAIHEMIHLVEAPAPFADGEPDFLVNEQLNDPRDATDPYDLPDTVYLSDGSRHPVALVLESTVNGTVSAGNYTIELQVPAPGKGFVYARVPEPTAGQYALTRVVRSDGVEITLDKNAWVTGRTFRSPYERPIYEHNLHLFDYNSSGRYTLHYEAPAAPDNTAPASQVQALPASSRPQITLQWAGTDVDGGGIATYDLYVSEEGGAFTLISGLRDTTATSAIFTGQPGRRYAFYSVATDRAGNREAAPASPDAETLVSLANQAPVLGAFSEQIINEGDTFAYLVTASDPDLPQDQLSFELSGQPAGLTLTKISATQALLQWATGEAAGPGAYEFAVTVRDGQSPQLSDTKTLRVVVNEVNTPPVLEAVGFRRVNKGQWLMVTNQARDFDLPAQSITYSLGAGAPAGMNINPLSGLLSWQPQSAQAGKTNVVAVIARDSGSPSLSATQWLTVAVRNLGPDFTVSVGTTNLFAGESGSVPFNLKCGLSLKELTFALGGAGGDRLSDWNLSDMRAGLGATLRPRAGVPNQYELSFSASEADPIHGTFMLARLGFRAVATNSGVVLLLPKGATGVTTEGQTNANSASVYGRVFVVVEEPILDAQPMTNQVRALVLYGLPDRDYVLESKASLADPASWTKETDLHLDGPMKVITWELEAPEDRFFRAYMIRNP